MEKIDSFRDIKTYQKAYKNSLELHKLSLSFPKYEQHGLADQMRRATKSIAMNIAEGFGKYSSIAEFKRYLMIALGSCEEVRVQLDYCKDLEYISQEQYLKYEAEYIEIKKMLLGMIRNWRKI